MKESEYRQTEGGKWSGIEGRCDEVQDDYERRIRIMMQDDGTRVKSEGAMGKERYE